MARTFVIHACLIFLTFCPGKGTNRWRKIIHNYGRDFSPQKRMFDYNKPAIEDFGAYYDPYDDYSKNEYTNNLEYDENENLWNTDDNLRSNNSLNTTVTKPIKYSHIIDRLSTKHPTLQALKWPKFEDMLLEMGRRYDWKNDRWLKVKKKIKSLEKRKNLTSVHEKHKFIYRIVRLNRPKSKRNIVLAVTAVR